MDRLLTCIIGDIFKYIWRDEVFKDEENRLEGYYITPINNIKSIKPIKHSDYTDCIIKFRYEPLEIYYEFLRHIGLITWYKFYKYKNNFKNLIIPCGTYMHFSRKKMFDHYTINLYNGPIFYSHEHLYYKDKFVKTDNKMKFMEFIY